MTDKRRRIGGLKQDEEAIDNAYGGLEVAKRGNAATGGGSLSGRRERLVMLTEEGGCHKSGG